MRKKFLDGTIDQVHSPHRTCGAQVHDQLGHIAFALLQPGERVAKDINVRREVLCKLIRAQERHFCAPFLCDTRDLLVVSRNYGARNVVRLMGLRDCVGNQGPPGDGENVLARNSL